MNAKLFISVLVVFKLSIFLLGKMLTKFQPDQQHHYSGEKNYALFPLVMTLIGAVFGGGSVLGSAEEAYRYGPAFILYPIGYCLGFLVIAFGTGKKLRSMEASTIPQVFGKAYRSAALRVSTSLISITSLFLILIIQVVAFKKFLVALDLFNPWLFGAFWLFVFYYTVSGGFKAVVTSHVVQLSFFICILLAAFLMSIFSNAHPVVDLIAQPTPLPLSKALGWLLMPVLFFGISQDLGQRTFAAKSNATMVVGTVTAGLSLILLMAIPIFFGAQLAQSGLHPQEGASVFMLAISKLSNPQFTALMAAGILLAVTSSSQSLLNAISSHIYHDFSLEKSIQRFKPTKWASLLVALLAFWIALNTKQIIDVVILSYEISICTLLVPFIALFIKKEGNAMSAFASLIVGLSSLIYFRIQVGPSLPGYQFAALALSLLSYLMVEGLMRRRFLAKIQK